LSVVIDKIKHSNLI